MKSTLLALTVIALMFYEPVHANLKGFKVKPKPDRPVNPPLQEDIEPVARPVNLTPENIIDKATKHKKQTIKELEQMLFSKLDERNLSSLEEIDLEQL